MWTALANAAIPVASGGKLFLAIYNDQGTASRRWTNIKKPYNQLPRGLEFVAVWPSFWVLNWRLLVKDFFRGKPFQSICDYGKNQRGMSFWQDLVDWVGGYPFEVAMPEQIFDFYRECGFVLVRLKTCRGTLGCNEFVLEKGELAKAVVLGRYRMSTRHRSRQSGRLVLRQVQGSFLRLRLSQLKPGF
jgi:2-polyprenyl-6-hydroxyphenyl methylase/3-demethylubiquinone-9 3-methyltransferase